MLVTINGQPPKMSVEALLTGNAFNYGYAVFETMRADKGKIFMLAEHLHRLEQSAKIIGLHVPKQTATIQKYIASTIESCNFNPIRLKLIASDTDIFIIASNLVSDASLYKGVKCVTADMQRQFPLAKTLHYLDSFLAHQYAVQHQAYEALLINENNHITEGAYSNFFGVKHGRLVTAKKGILPGITRQVVLQMAEEAKIPIIARGMLASEANVIDEAFITQSTRGIVPINQIDNYKIGSGNVGNTTLKLMELYAKALKNYEM